MSENFKNVLAERSYDETYRFRLWVAAVEHSTSLGMGFRAYHSHIMSSLEEWSRLGNRFLNTSQKPLSFDVLSPDDLYGFLGKKTCSLSGPGRNIKNYKLAILDVFFKYSLPEMAKSFSSNGVSTLIPYTMNVFFNQKRVHGPTGTNLRIHVRNRRVILIEAPNGAFYRHKRKNNDRIFSQVIFIKYREYSKHYVIQQIMMPMHQKLFTNEGAISDAQLEVKKFSRYFLSGADIFTGVGVACNAGWAFEIMCMLRERTTLDPRLLSLSVMFERKPEGEGSIIKIEEFCTRHGVATYEELNSDGSIGNSEWVISNSYMNELNRLYDSLGMEI